MDRGMAYQCFPPAVDDFVSYAVHVGTVLVELPSRRGHSEDKSRIQPGPSSFRINRSNIEKINGRLTVTLKYSHSQRYLCVFIVKSDITGCEKLSRFEGKVFV